MTIYVNRTLNMKQVKAIGFDMDHTLVRYKKKAFEQLTYDEMKKKLVKVHGYPAAVSKLEFDPEKTIRGLVIDKDNGNLIKISLHSRIKQAYHGLKELDYKEQMRLYKGHYVDLNDARYATIDTTFSVPYAVLYAQLVDLKDKNPQDNYPDYRKLEKQLLDALDMSHRDGSLKNEVRKDVSKFIVQDAETVEVLERLKKYEKKLWVITNSDYDYTKLLLDYTMTPFLKEHKHWSELFDIVVTSAMKPRFFTDNLKFLEIDPKTGLMKNTEGPFQHGLFQGGCATALEKDNGIAGEDILYLGDHIFGDILTLKKACNWRTALVVEELEEEVDNYKKASQFLTKIDDLMAKKTQVEIELDELYAKEFELKKKVDKKQVQEQFNLIKDIDLKLSKAIKEQQKLFNPYWGEVMRAGQEASRFAGQIEKYACIYMSKISDFKDYSPRTYFRPKKRTLPHEMD
ncbi:MAG: HAD-IG family 5'-nucleotidase [Bacteriovoracaceae bacterium]|nr:HAD-IG family 5'-nucleotidase [Bacteriovoracaceae bacterium]